MGMEAIDDARGLAFLCKQSELDAEASGWRMLGVERLERPGLIGEVGVFLSESDPTEGDLGWLLHPEHRGKGYAAEAARALVEWCFGERGLQCVTAACLADNAASRSVLERIGIHFERQWTASRRVGDQLLDECGYGLSRTDWAAQT